MKIPHQLIQSLQHAKGFNSKAFEALHNTKETITSVRINPFKTSIEKLLFNNYQQVGWCQHGYYLSERPSFTLDPFFHAGAYYVQEASSMFLWKVLQQTITETNNKKVLDVCAAPGGKSTLLSTYFNNGLVVSNEVIKQRANILTENITKWGLPNVVATNNDPKQFKQLENYFDVIVIDAPCSGSGLFRKDEEAVNEWSENNVMLCNQRQQRIIADIMNCLKQDGILIYSTCSFSIEENETILDWVCDTFNTSTIQIQLQTEWNITETQSTKHNAYGYRFWPYLTKGEGFFMAAFKKNDGALEHNKIKTQALISPSKNEMQIMQSFIQLSSKYSFFKQNENIKAIENSWLNELQTLAKYLFIKKAGVELGAVKGKDFIPSHELAVSVLSSENLSVIELDKEQALQYLRRQEVSIQSQKGWQLVAYCGLPLGWIKVLPNRINNYYPNEWRILKQ
ncbi:MAG: RNA methyltransferase [Bacteroidetes bacterium]|nr:RNA methyltransferase [Bacteroidota bacterium]MBS1671767.1 RNA methyltransferase [Bacteroidota bacterium]